MSRQDELAFARWEESLALFRSLADDRATAGVLHRLALEPLASGDYERARQLVDESQTLADGRSRLIETVNLMMYSKLALAGGSLDEAVELSRRSADMARELGWKWWESGQRINLLRLALQQGDLEQAEREGCAALAIEREQENRLYAASTLSGLAQVALAEGDLVHAGMLWGAAEREAEQFPPAREEERFIRDGALLEESGPEFLAGSSADASSISGMRLRSPSARARRRSDAYPLSIRLICVRNA